MKYNYNKLRGLIVEKFGTQGNFANALGVTETTVSRKMNSGRGFSHEDIEKWSELLDIEIDSIGAYFFT